MVSQKITRKLYSGKKYLAITAVVFLFILPIFSGSTTISASANSAPSFAISSQVSLSDLVVSSPPLKSAQPTCTAGGAPYCPSQILTGYDFEPLLTGSPSYTGKGQNVTLVDACLTESKANFDSDLDTFLTEFYAVGSLGSTFTLDEYTPFGAPTAAKCPGSLATGWDEETALDVEWAHAAAPNAIINLVMADSQADLTKALTFAINHNLGKQISNSWSMFDTTAANCPTGTLCTDYATPCSGFASTLNNATTDGKTVFASTWDHSAWGTDTKIAPQFPADCAGVTGVGGTSLTLMSSNAYSGEEAWGNGSTSHLPNLVSGSGGGYVNVTAEPAYQKQVHIPEPSGISTAELGKPDVSADANPQTGVWIYSSPNGGWVAVGGTSLSSPLWAGFMADANQWRIADGYSSTGYLNTFLYEYVYGYKGEAPYYYEGFAFHDVTTGSNGWSAATGWDAATGLGSFIAYDLAWIIATTPAA